jgi:hypothetical protein
MTGTQAPAQPLRISPTNWMLLADTFLSRTGLLGLPLLGLGLWGMPPFDFPAGVPVVGGMAASGVMWKLGALLLLIGFARTLFSFVTTGTLLDLEQGTLVIRRFRGSFTTNTVMLSQVYDCDIHADIRQALVGSGDLIIATVDGLRHVIPWAIRAEDARKLIVDQAGGRRLHTVGMI